MSNEPNRARVLVVDDDDMVRGAISRYLQRTGFDITQASDGAQALQQLEERTFEAVLCDIRMPGMTGVELLPKVLAKDPDLAVLMLTAVGDPESAIGCLRVGAADYLVKPVELEELQHALRSALRKRELEVERRGLEQWLAREVADKTRALEEQSRQVELLSLSILTVLVDAADPPAGGRNHSMRVAGLAAHVAAELALSADEIETARMAGRLHELGRIVGHNEALRISASRQVAPPAGDGDRASDDIAARILDPLRQHADVVDAIRCQHEYWDGSRPPALHTGESIPIAARIIAAVNLFDELTDATTRREPLTEDEAAARVRRDSGTVLDPKVVAALEVVLSRRR
jgi:response regulator RpfG family c-di-GMP phosphodiesterase